MSAVAEIIALLRDSAGTPFAMVQGAAQLAQVTDKPRAMPAAFVLAGREASGENPYATGTIEQRMERDIAVVIVTEDLTDDQGATAVGDIEAAQDLGARQADRLPADRRRGSHHACQRRDRAGLRRHGLVRGRLFFADLPEGDLTMANTNERKHLPGPGAGGRYTRDPRTGKATRVGEPIRHPEIPATPQAPAAPKVAAAPQAPAAPGRRRPKSQRRRQPAGMAPAAETGSDTSSKGN